MNRFIGSAADLRVDISQKNPEQIAELILENIRNFPGRRISVTSEIEQRGAANVGRGIEKSSVAFARELDSIRAVLPLALPRPMQTEFRNWLRKVRSGEMSYMERGEEKRCDPQKVLAGRAVGHCYGTQLLARSRQATRAA